MMGPFGWFDHTSKRENARLQAEREQLFERIEELEKEAAVHLSAVKRMARQNVQLSERLEQVQAANEALCREAVDRAGTLALPETPRGHGEVA
jgi:predicted nuclease with TOPRIM domain